MILKTLYRILETYVFSNVHIAISSSIYMLGAVNLTEEYTIENISLIILIGIATFIVYNTHRLIGHYKLNDATAPFRIKFVQRNWWIIVIIGLATSLIAFQYIYHIVWELWIVIAPCLLLTAMYLFPVFPNHKRLRDLAFIKIFIIALVWAGVFVMPLFIGKSIAYSPLVQNIIFLEKVFFFIMITIPFDYRDRRIDRTQGTQTIATITSEKNLKGIILLLGLLSVTCVLILTQLNLLNLRTSISLILSYIISIALSIYGISNKSELYYLGVLDGLIMVNGAAYII